MGHLRSLAYWITALDPALTWDQRLTRWVNVSAVVGIVGTAVAAVFGYFFSYPWLWVVGLGVWVLLLSGLVTLGRWAGTDTSTEPVAKSQSERATQQRSPESTEPMLPGDEMGITVTQWTDTHPWIKKDEMDSDPIRQRSIHIADFALRRHAGAPTGTILKERTFDNCHIYGPAVLAPLATGEVGGKTFVRCQRLNQEDEFWWPNNHVPEHAGTVKLEDCLFRDCIFTNVGVAGSPEHDGEVTEYQA